MFVYVEKDGNTYYYKINKNAYINEYLSTHLLENADDLTIMYHPTENDASKKFTVINKNEVALSANKIWELENNTEALTTTYLDLLSDTELKALKETSIYIYSSLVKSDVEMINRELYEEAEILKILDY